VAGSTLIVLDRNGQELQVRDLGERLARSPQWVDVDGDGTPELVALLGGASGPYSVTAWSLKTGQALWRKALSCSPYRDPPPGHKAEDGPSPDWPVVADLDGHTNRSSSSPGSTASAAASKLS